MWKFTAHYENYNGEEKEKVLRFGLTATEIRELSFSKEGGIDNYYKEILETKDPKKIYEVFEEFVRLSYGVVSEDGESFIKSDEEYAKFRNSPAYEVFMDYITLTEDGASKFFTGIIPKKYLKLLNTPEGKKIAEENGIDLSALPKNI